MNKQNKILFIVLFFVCFAALALGIYFYPDAGPTPPPGFTATDNPAAADKTKPDTASLTPTASSAETGLPAKAASQAAEKHSPDASKDDDADPFVSFPEDLMALLDIDLAALEQGRDAFKNTVTHVGWMDRINDVLKNLDSARKAAIIKNHTTLLYVKDRLNEAYLTGRINHETFKKAITDLMKWHQHTYSAILSTAEYEALFEISPELVDDTIEEIINQAPEYSFVLNPNISEKALKEQVPGYKLEEVDSHFKKMILTRDQIGKQINAGKMNLDQARESMAASQHEFIQKCKEILTEEEINTIFGSVTALETGAVQTEAPAVLGDTDKVELGFEIENPATSIDKVKETVDPQKIEDIRFFYQEREKEREKVIEQLDAGEIPPEQMEDISREIDAAFEENCRAVLTGTEYDLLFENSDADPQETPADAETENDNPAPQPAAEGDDAQ